MRKEDYIPKTCNAAIYGKLAREEATKHTTVNNFIEEMKPEVTKCNICGSLISAKEAMMPCGPYHSVRTGKYVCPHCYGNYVIPLIDGLAEMERTADREELMKERDYRG